MATIKCENCDNDISSEAFHCPKCGHPNNIKYCLSVRHQFFFFMVAIALILLIIILTEKHLDNKEFDIYQHVAEDAVEHYNIASQSGDHSKKCLHARIAAAAYLKTNSEAKYQHWKLIGQTECRH